jgi:DNA polymerase-3 subunit chi
MAEEEAAPIECGFYHLLRTPLEPALGRLLEKALAGGHRALVRASSKERVEALNRALWTVDRDGFLPHGSAEDGEAAAQPIYLTVDEESPNGATVLVLVDGAEGDPAPPVERCLYMFDGNDADAVAQARRVWTRWRERGFRLVYWQQTERGWNRAMATD